MSKIIRALFVYWCKVHHPGHGTVAYKDEFTLAVIKALNTL